MSCKSLKGDAMKNVPRTRAWLGGEPSYSVLKWLLLLGLELSIDGWS